MSSRSHSIVANHHEKHIEEDRVIESNKFRFPWYTVWLAASIQLVSGIFSTYSFKIEDRIRAPRCGDVSNPECSEAPFSGANLQTFIMFVGESLCLILYAIDHAVMARKGQPPFFDMQEENAHKKREAKWWYWTLASLCDFGATLSYSFALFYIYASTEQMLTNFYIFFAGICQLVLVRRALRIHEYISVTIITVSMILTAIPAIQTPETSSEVEAGKAWLGVLLCIFGTALQSFQSVYEEFIFVRFRYGPVKAVGVEGCVGLVMGAVSMIIFHHIGEENAYAAWYQFGHSQKIQTTFGLYLIACILFNCSGLVVTKLGSGLLRLVCTALRTPAVWILDIALGWMAYDHYNLAGTFVFLIGFVIHVRMWPAEKIPGFHMIMSKPLHHCCTNPNLDEDLTWLTGLNEEDKDIARRETVNV
eukprot:Blabericola_migrator_1__12811@NODE_825_length_6370_cov_320_094241_g582_i0_p1_GENE_NODE_825_length_6370_cov_320_094241_g582_i0NODE_825_length_6370_cov_320_094241_g582_i0_p1_ORF_typecomplete_len419_score64_92SLC35F/PF06027_12/2_8e03SLC35F/PF06027_12/8_5e23CRTlike/PF08627_10/1_7e21CRTlike/PF08627_10/8_2e02Nuc_sug_transp/PF04142_15/1e03Nuc_sug_transp/PF04142_15/2_6e18UAA/PF08449_11/4_7e02UAA/PF08449_11/1_5e17PUNUT/PF16913_5/6_7e16TPT/PF03151_16/4_8e12EamA/PF00892_20/3_2e05EamA/PF00892_20/3_2e02EamA/